MSTETSGTPLVQIKDLSIAFGGIKAVDKASVDLHPGEVVAILGHNGAGKSTLIKVLSGAYKRDEGQIFVNGEEADINNPRDAKKYGIETIYQTLAVADNVDAAANLYLGREILTNYGTLDDAAMESEARKVMGRLNPNFQRFKEPVSKLSGGQRQSVAIARAILFNARILIMDEPTAALGPQETDQVSDLIQQLKQEGIGIFLISHDIHDVFDLADRVAVMKNGQMVGYAKTEDVTKDEVLGMIIMGKCPAGATPGPGLCRKASRHLRERSAKSHCVYALAPANGGKGKGTGMSINHIHKGVIAGIAICAFSAITTPAGAAQTHPSFAPVVMPPHVYDGGWEFFVGGGMAVFDCNQDSLPDIFIAGGEAPSALLRNRSQRGGEIKFTKQTPQELSLENVTGAYPLDIDGDGFLDLAVLRVGANVILKGAAECNFTPFDNFKDDYLSGWTTSFSATWETGQSLPTMAFGN